MKDSSIAFCNAGYNHHGLGIHFAQVVEELRASDQLLSYFCPSPQEGDAQGQTVSNALGRAIIHFTPIRFFQSWRHAITSQIFDYQVSQKLPSAKSLVGFSGQALHSFYKARRMGFSHLALESPTSHVANAWRQLQKAHQRYPLESGFLNPSYVRRMRKEYTHADTIVVASEYSRQSFLAEGFSSEQLQMRQLRILDRYNQVQRQKTDDFQILYVGRLSIDKGVPLLLEAFSRFPHSDARLNLLGSTSSRGMHQLVKEALAQDTRIHWDEGDPLPYYQTADVFVHPSFQDGFGLAPQEALNCGIKVIVTEDTGMKENIVEGENGYILPTGNLDALIAQLEELYQKL